MAKRPGHVEVVTEVGFCNFCNRTRNLRREEHRLGGLVRTIVSCETCHRTLSSTMGIASEEPAPVKDEEPAAAEKPTRATAKETAGKEPAARKSAARKPAAKKPAAKPKTAAKPRSTAARKATPKK